MTPIRASLFQNYVVKYGKRIVNKICQLIESDDYTIAEICQQVGIHIATWYDWKENKPEFTEAIKKADDLRLELFKKAARSGLLILLQGKEYEEVTTEYVSGKDDKPKIKSQKKVKKFILPNPTSVIFTLKNLDPDQFPELMRGEFTGKDGKPLIAPVIKLPDGTTLEI